MKLSLPVIGFRSSFSSIFVRIVLLLAFSTGVVATTLVLFSRGTVFELADNSIRERAQDVTKFATTQASGATKYRNVDGLNTLLETLSVNSGPNLKSAIVIDKEGTVLARTGPSNDALNLLAQNTLTNSSLSTDRNGFYIAEPVYFGKDSELVGAIAMAWSAAALRERIEHEQRYAMLASMAVFAAAVAISMVILKATVTGPLMSVRQVMERYANGDYDKDVREAARADEIGALARDLMVFKENGLEKQRLEKSEKEALVARRAEEQRAAEVEAARLRAEAEQEKAELEKQERRRRERQAELDAQAEERARLDAERKGVVVALEHGLRKLSEGDLSIRLEQPFPEAYEAIRSDFNAALTTLAMTMQRVMQSGQTVLSTSSELEASSIGMAKRGEDNAATVEETSAAVEQITASIRQVVANARAADEATQRVRQRADNARIVSDETESSINAMTEASEEINRVVKVIKDIAFQINLLALNAGVEAARAGEAGRGFSVVASEVRALAQRSQEAVQEISQVIEKNNQSVEAGVEKIGSSREALEGILSEIEVASGQISDIAMAVEQQSGGIEEINSAIRSIDTTAQTNAATLEEMTACTVSLNEEANALAKALQQFRGLSIDKSLNQRSNVVPLTTPTATTSEEREKIATAVGHSGVSQDGWDEF